MRIIYVAGPYRSQTEWGVEKNIMRAEDAALKLWSRGWMAYCPHKNTAHFGGACADKIWLEGNLEMLKRCDAICLIEGWESSSGSRKEKELAEEEGKIVYCGVDDVPPESQ